MMGRLIVANNLAVHDPHHLICPASPDTAALPALVLSSGEGKPSSERGEAARHGGLEDDHPGFNPE